MKLRQHIIPSAQGMITGNGVLDSIIAMTQAYRASLDKHYAKDITAVRSNLEEITCQRLSIKQYEVVGR